MYLSRGMAGGHFSSALQLIKVECLLQPVNKFPLVQTLNMMCDVFPSPKRRLIILSQILIYYNYCENNPKEMMHYLKLYIDQDIEDTFKKRHLIVSLSNVITLYLLILQETFTFLKFFIFIIYLKLLHKSSFKILNVQFK